MKTKLKSYGYYIGIAIMGIAIGSLLQFAKATWTEPALAPPNSNVGAPINTSANSQIKSGFLTAGAVISPVMCIGSDCKSAWPSASGDNLGDHRATKSLNMNGNTITGVTGMTVNVGGVNFTLKYFNGGEDSASALKPVANVNTMTDSCNGDKYYPYTCGVMENRTCNDTYFSSSLSSNVDSNGDYGEVTVTCKRALSFVE